MNVSEKNVMNQLMENREVLLLRYRSYKVRARNVRFRNFLRKR